MKLRPVALDVTPDGDIKVLLSKGSTTGINPEIIFKADADFQKSGGKSKSGFDHRTIAIQFEK